MNDFKNTVWDYYHDNQRSLPWRKSEADGTFNAYKIMVSEIMLQQTQANRVIEKYVQFLKVYPDIGTLAGATLEEVFNLWQGLGYNRRAKFLRDAAKLVISDFQSEMPRSVSDLVKLPGVGHNTACAIAVYSYNQPLVFIETNIRTVYLHHFFEGKEDVADAAILELVAQTVDNENPREWYWALMDYGTYLKKAHGNANVRSRHYAKQSRFEGSARQIRGEVLRQLQQAPQTLDELNVTIPDSRLASVLDGLLKDQLIRQTHGKYMIAL